MTAVPSQSPLLPTHRIAALRRSIGALAPGLLLTVLLAGLGVAVRQASGFAALSPLIVAVAAGMAVRNLFGAPAMAAPGIRFAMRPILRFAIVLLGLQLTLRQVMEVGAPGLLVIAVTLVATFLATKACGKLLGVDARLAEMIAAGTAVCGASAVIAANSVSRAQEEDVCYAVACVTVFGSISMLLFPALSPLLPLSPQSYGLWIGASIHEIAQVVAAAFQNGPAAGEAATIAKLSRVMLLAPLVLAMGFFAGRGGKGASAPTPWFVLGFAAMIGLNSFGLFPQWIKAPLIQATPFLLAMALAAMGLQTDFRQLRAKGLRPLLLGAASWAFVSCLSLGLVILIG